MWEMSRDHLSRGSIILGGNCPSAIILGQFSSVGIVRGHLSQGKLSKGELSCSQEKMLNFSIL